MNRRTVTVLPGDGIGPEVVGATLKVLEALGAPLIFETLPLATPDGEELSLAAIESISCNGVALKGPTATPLGEGRRSLNVGLREAFDLYANVRPVHEMPNVKTLFSGRDVDIVVFRENVEDLYIGEESGSDVCAEAISRITWAGSTRIARYAFDYARRQGRKKITVVHKANILKLTHGLFLKAARAVAAEYPEIECNDLIADNCMMQIVCNPQWFDCLLAPNLFGDLLSDLTAGLIGGLGFAPGANIGSNVAVFEAVHGTAPDIAGKRVANPTAVMLSAALMLDYLGLTTLGDRFRHAIDGTLRAGIVTRDVSKTDFVGMDVFTDAVIARL